MGAKQSLHASGEPGFNGARSQSLNRLSPSSLGLNHREKSLERSLRAASRSPSTLPDNLAPVSGDDGMNSGEDEEEQEISVSFGYHCRAHYRLSSDTMALDAETQAASLLSSAPVSGSAPESVHFFNSSLYSLVNPQAAQGAGTGSLTPCSSSPSLTETRRRNSSFSFLSGAAMGANATLANSILVSSTHSRGLLCDMDSPKAFRHMRCPHQAQAQGTPSLGVAQWIGPQASAPPSKDHIDQQKALGFSLLPLSSSSTATSWLAGVQVGSAGSASSACSTSSSMSSSAPDLSGPSFLLANDVQVAGGAAGEDRVQAVCSEENGWLFCGVYDGFNGRDAADFLAANLYENIGMHLRLQQWQAQGGTETAPLGTHATRGIQVESVDRQDASPNEEGGSVRSRSPIKSALLPIASKGRVGPSGSLASSAPEGGNHLCMWGPPGSADSAPSGGGVLNFSFLQPWVHCSCGSSLCECPSGHAHASVRMSSPPTLPTVREDEGSLWSSSRPLHGADKGSKHNPSDQEQQQQQQQQPCMDGAPGAALQASAGKNGTVVQPSVGKEVPLGTATGTRDNRTETFLPVGPGTAPQECQAAPSLDAFEQVVCIGLRKALAFTEREFFRMVEQEMQERSDLAMVGSCVLALLIHGNHLFTMNLGDSRAVLATWSPLGRSGSTSVHSSTGSSTVSLNGSSSTSSCFGITCPEEFKAVKTSTTRISSIGDMAYPRSLSPCGSESSGRGVRDEGLSVGDATFGLEGANSEGLVDGEQQQAAHHLRAVQLSETHCVDYEPERERVMREHPSDPNAVIGHRVKGKLRVTRAFGAGYLKNEKMNNSLMGIFRVKNLESPPYVSSEAHVTAHELSPLDQFVVIGSDGLFDFFSNEEAIQFVARFLAVNPHGDPAKHMLEELLVRAAEKAGKTVEELKSIPHGKRRKYHDDTTVIVITLGHTFRTTSASTLF